MKCKATTKKGESCSNNASGSSEYCAFHKPKVDNRNKTPIKYPDESREVKSLLKVINEGKNIVEVFEALEKFRNIIDKENAGYKYYVSEEVIYNFRNYYMKKVTNKFRLDLIVDYIFIYDSRDMKKSYTTFDLPEVEDFDMYIVVGNFRFRGYDKDVQPRREEIKINNKIPNLNFNKVDSKIFETLNESYIFNELIDAILFLKDFIESANPKYNFYINREVLDFIKIKLNEFICSKRRVDLVLGYIFQYEKRVLDFPVKYYCCCEKISKTEWKFINSILPRGCSKPPNREEVKFEPKTEPEPEANPAPKPQSQSEPKPEVKPAPKPAPSPDVSKELKEYLGDKDVNTFLNIIKTPTTNLKNLSRKDIILLFKEFHPDKAGGCEVTQKLCNLISSKLSVIKKQNEDSGSPVRPIGSLYKELCNILNIKY